jgi:hypothetical protein
VSLTLSIEALQKAGTCRAGQVEFRRKFSRTRTWETLELFERAMYDNSELWNWDEACEQFGVDTDAWTNLSDKLYEDESQDEEDDSDHHRSYSRSQARAVAWARLYWARAAFQKSQDPAVPAARAYIKAVEELESALAFRAKLRSGTKVEVDIGFTSYYKDDAVGVKRYMAEVLKHKVEEFADEAIAKFEANVRLKKLELKGAITEEQVQPAPTLVAAE